MSDATCIDRQVRNRRQSQEDYKLVSDYLIIGWSRADPKLGHGRSREDFKLVLRHARRGVISSTVL